ncbi:MAG: DNA repair protein RecN, partial [Selenomonadaceae bacterium]|nr:DNA repair protein RecN [Selenomonadaceae bacterium]
NTINNSLKMLEEASITLNEVFSEIRSYGDQFEFSPARLDELQNRMELIHRLKKKYGSTVEDVMAYHEKIRRDILSIENYDADVEIIEQRILKLETQTRKRAEILTKSRQQSAKTLSAAIEKELQQLGMSNAKFTITITQNDILSINGADDVDMLFSANAGEEVQPLSKIASGGELSRIALAIKAINADRDDSASIMVFDEIDTGLGGVTANAVAECIAKVAKYKQVLCITHLPQIACMADVHILIEKTVDNERTLTNVTRLSESDRVKEIARMASGDDASDASMENARTMLMNAIKRKRMIAIQK